MREPLLRGLILDPAVAGSFNSGSNSNLTGPPVPLSFYPNPVEDNMYVTTTETSKIYYKIMNITGQIVDGGVLNNNIVDVQNLNKGIYILKLTSENDIMIKQFVKK